MYVVISWDISASNPRWSQINDEMKNCIAAYDWTRPVNTFYMMRINSPDEIVAIRKCFNAVADRVEVNVSYILSPAFIGPNHVWSGRVGDWQQVNAITAG